jgi:acetyl-CoA synthetase
MFEFLLRSAGNTVVLFDSSYSYPNPGRIWETIERLEVTAFSLYPAIVRDLMTFDEEWATKRDLRKLRSITVGL